MLQDSDAFVPCVVWCALCENVVGGHTGTLEAAVIVVYSRLMDGASSRLAPVGGSYNMLTIFLFW